jgi:hypothetical protein
MFCNLLPITDAEQLDTSEKKIFSVVYMRLERNAETKDILVCSPVFGKYRIRMDILWMNVSLIGDDKAIGLTITR